MWRGCAPVPPLRSLRRGVVAATRLVRLRLRLRLCVRACACVRRGRDLRAGLHEDEDELGVGVGEAAVELRREPRLRHLPPQPAETPQFDQLSDDRNFTSLATIKI